MNKTEIRKSVLKEVCNILQEREDFFTNLAATAKAELDIDYTYLKDLSTDLSKSEERDIQIKKIQDKESIVYQAIGAIHALHLVHAKLTQKEFLKQLRLIESEAEQTFSNQEN